MLCGFAIALLGYIVLHEAGHCLIALLCGAEITEFSIITTHMSYTGGEFTRLTSSLLNAAGTLLPICVSLVYIALYKSESKSVFYTILSFIISMASLFSLVTWIVLPVLYSMGKTVAGEDVTKFLVASGINPYIVSITALALFIAMVMFILGKKIAGNYRAVLRSLAAK